MLLVEDDAMVALAIAETLAMLDCPPVRHHGDAAGALALLSGPDGGRVAAALVDVNLGPTDGRSRHRDGDGEGESGGMAVADQLAARGTPFAFLTGDRLGIAPRHAARPVLEKPFRMAELERLLADLTGDDAL